MDGIDSCRYPDACHQPCAQGAGVEAPHSITMNGPTQARDRVKVTPSREGVLPATAGGEDRPQIALLRHEFSSDLLSEVVELPCGLTSHVDRGNGEASRHRWIALGGPHSQTKVDEPW